MDDIGIYKITCTANNKVYIGQSRHMNYRFSEHLLLLNQHKHFNRHLQFAFDKYGEDCFKFDVLEYCDTNMLTERESYWIKEYGGINSSNTFNVQDVQEPYHFTLEVRNKISKNNKR